jgi:hypothetical protein
MKKWIRCFGAVVLVVPFLLTANALVGAADHEFVGSKKCKKCHLKQHKSWAATKMAKAFDALKPGERAEQKTAAGLDPEKDYTKDAECKDYTKDAECIKCHVTGYGKAGGFVDIETTPDLAGVGCETCHGAGATYIQDQYMSLKNKEYKKEEIVAVGMTDQVGAEQCTGCHNSESPFVADDFVFDFEANKETGTHENFPLKYKH